MDDLETDLHPAAQRLAALFARHGNDHYDGGRQEAVTALQHALQAAQLAEWAGADAPLVVAALLHDVGHFADGVPSSPDVDDAHEQRALPMLRADFGPEVLEPIRLHVAAKRYLVATDARYAATLSAASIHTLAQQGGPMSEAECRAFEAEPFAPQAVMLRRWDDAAKEPNKATPSLAYFLPLLEQTLLHTPQKAPRTVVGALDA